MTEDVGVQQPSHPCVLLHDIRGLLVVHPVTQPLLLVQLHLLGDRDCRHKDKDRHRDQDEDHEDHEDRVRSLRTDLIRIVLGGSSTRTQEAAVRLLVRHLSSLAYCLHQHAPAEVFSEAVKLL